MPSKLPRNRITFTGIIQELEYLSYERSGRTTAYAKLIVREQGARPQSLAAPLFGRALAQAAGIRAGAAVRLHLTLSHRLTPQGNDTTAIHVTKITRL